MKKSYRQRNYGGKGTEDPFLQWRFGEGKGSTGLHDSKETLVGRIRQGESTILGDGGD